MSVRVPVHVQLSRALGYGDEQEQGPRRRAASKVSKAEAESTKHSSGLCSSSSMAKLKCDVCEMQQASLYCEADEAYLCFGCDSTVHGANTLASRHKRVELQLQQQQHQQQQAQQPQQRSASNDRACPGSHFQAFVSETQGSLDFPPGGIRIGDITFARVSGEQQAAATKDDEESHQVPRFVPVAQELPSLEPFRFHALATGEDLPRFNGKFMSLLGNESGGSLETGEADRTDDDASPVQESVELGVVPDLTQPSTKATTTEDKEKEPVKGIKADKEREARVNRYREKRRTRMFSKKIRYEVRKIYAENRPRLKGRFVRRTDWQQEQQVSSG